MAKTTYILSSWAFFKDISLGKLVKVKITP